MDFAYLTSSASQKAPRAQRERLQWHAATHPTTGGWRTACNGASVDVQTRTAPYCVPALRRCQANGCRQVWAAYIASITADDALIAELRRKTPSELL